MDFMANRVYQVELLYIVMAFYGLTWPRTMVFDGLI